MSRNARPVWIKEDEAAALMNYHPRYFRHLVKSGKLDIAFSSPTGRKFQYNLHDIQRTQLQHSNFIS